MDNCDEGVPLGALKSEARLDTADMYPAEIGPGLLGNWDIREYDFRDVAAFDADSDHFNAKYGVFQVKCYQTQFGPRRVFVKGYGRSGLEIGAGRREAGALACAEQLGASTPRHALDVLGGWSYQQEVIGSRLDAASEQILNRISLDQYLQFASLFPVLGADDFRPVNIFVGANGRLWPIDLDSAFADLNCVGEFYPGHDTKFERTVTRIIRAAEQFPFSVTRDQVHAQVQTLAEYVLTEQQILYQIISRYLDEELADKMFSQIGTIADGDFISLRRNVVQQPLPVNKYR